MNTKLSKEEEEEEMQFWENFHEGKRTLNEFFSIKKEDKKAKEEFFLRLRAKNQQKNEQKEINKWLYPEKLINSRFNFKVKEVELIISGSSASNALINPTSQRLPMLGQIPPLIHTSETLSFAWKFIKWGLSEPILSDAVSNASKPQIPNKGGRESLNAEAV